MYVLTDLAIDYARIRSPSITHFVVTNGDNIYATNFFARTCHHPEDLVATGLSLNGWDYGCSFQPELRVGSTDLGAVLISTRIFSRLHHRFLGNNIPPYTSRQRWWQERDRLESAHKLWKGQYVHHFSHMLDGVFFEAMATTPGITSVVVPEILFIHS
jgi:hypothetical protein